MTTTTSPCAHTCLSPRSLHRCRWPCSGPWCPRTNKHSLCMVAAAGCAVACAPTWVLGEQGFSVAG
eukprot:1155324-Pelagomonas_calceolata.AAC.5